jgi:hypothetical protein
MGGKTKLVVMRSIHAFFFTHLTSASVDRRNFRNMKYHHTSPVANELTNCMLMLATTVKLHVLD